jgi:phospholipase C
MSRLNLIEHFVVLMLENRSFDNILGALRPASPQFDGLTGNESNLDREGRRRPMQEAAGGNVAGLSYPTPDPGELWTDMNLQIFGSGQLENGASTPGAGANMSGFVESYTDPAGKPPRGAYDPAQLMRYYRPSRDVPAIAALAQSFAVCDCWFASAPCQTWPNRLFLHTGTAGGYENNAFDALWFDMPTVFGTFDAAPGAPTWAIYHHDIPQTLTLSELIEKPDHFHMFDTFLEDAKAGRLPNYAFIEPRYYSDVQLWPPAIELPNDQHPPHVVAFGDQLVASVYNALRANEEAWKKTMLIVIYDEHGGIFDHRPPGAAVAPGPVQGDRPDPASWPFHFNRYGVRVPAIVASPFVAPGSVLRPSDAYPADGATPFDHTSVIATLRARFDLGAPLTERVKSAPTLERVMAYDTPQNMGPESIVPSQCKVSLWYKIASLFELWNDFQQSLHHAARNMPLDAHGRAQNFIDRQQTPTDPGKRDGVRSDVGAIFANARYRAMRTLGLLAERRKAR